MVKTIKIGGKNVKMRSSAAIPRMYRQMFQRDIFKDVNDLGQEFNDGNGLPLKYAEVLESIAYSFAKHAAENEDFPPIDEWLAQFEINAIVNAEVDILNVWQNDNVQTSKDQNPDGKKIKEQ